ncbi:hypothetical protein NMG60_11022018 [Bertholletia excelsa]
MVHKEPSKLHEFSLNQPLVKKHYEKEPARYAIDAEEGDGLKSSLELERSVSSPFKVQSTDTADYEKDRDKYTILRDAEDFYLGTFDKPLPCFGCGIGWFSFLSGFIFPPLWYCATILYFGNYYRKDPRERDGLAASAIAAMACSVVLLIIALVLLF